MSENASIITNHITTSYSYFNNDIFEWTDDEVYYDIGAYKGNAIIDFYDTVGKKCSIVGIEAGRSIFKEMQENTSNHGIDCVHFENICISNYNGKAHFYEDGEEGRLVENDKCSIAIEARTIDSLARELNLVPTIMKINFPIGVREILEGARSILKENKTSLVIRIGFFEEVLVDVIDYLIDEYPEYNLYMRYTVGVPQGLTLFCQ